MKANLGTIDKAIRIILAVVIASLYFANLISGTTAIVLLIIAGVLLITGFISFCPLYFLLKINTLKSSKVKPV